MVQQTLRHTTLSTTADIYTTVLPELARAAADQTASIVPRHTHYPLPAANSHALPAATTTNRPVSPGDAEGHVVTVIDQTERNTA